MNSLTSEPVTTVLKRLFREAKIADRSLLDDFRHSAAHDPWTTLLEEEAKDYRALYRKCSNNFT